MKLFGTLLIAGTVTLTLLACKACRPQGELPPEFPPILETPRPAIGVVIGRDSPSAANPEPARGASEGELALVSATATETDAISPSYAAAPIDVRPAPIATIPPGTVVDKGPPRGWSHLVVKSLPRVREANRQQVNAITARMAAWMFTAFLADVRKNAQGQYELRAIALGLGANVKGQDLVLTSGTARRFAADLGLFGGRILDTAYERQSADSRILARSPTMAILDTPVWFHMNGVNRLIRFRYALLVDAVSGRLDVVVWAVDPAGKKWGESVGVIQVKESAVYPVDLIPDWNPFTQGIPSEGGFGVDQLPPGRPLPEFSLALAGVARQARLTREAAALLEHGLRTRIAAASSTPSSTNR